MGKETLIIFFGVWVAVQSFLGFPLLWDEIIYAVLGIAIVVLGLLLHRTASQRAPRVQAETFVERDPEAEAADRAAGAAESA